MTKTFNRYQRILCSYTSYILLMLAAIGLNLRGFWLASPLVFLFVIIPILDWLLPKDRSSFQSSDFNGFETFLCRAAPYGLIVGYATVFLFYCRALSNFNVWEATIAVVSIGAIGGINITAAHELVHKSTPIARAFSRLGFLFVGYMHFEYFHIYSHHKEAGTLKDNHTGWFNESFYQYLRRTVREATFFSIKFEKVRLKRKGFRWIGLKNRILWFVGLPLLLNLILLAFYGPFCVLFYVAQSIIAVLSLEAVSYIEHYGLMRKSKGNRYEAMGNIHSWDSYHRFSNYVTFMLQRHAAHHLNSSRDFFLLDTNDESPVLPMGYPLLILIVGSTRLWQKIIHPRIPNEFSTQPSFQKYSSLFGLKVKSSPQVQ